MAPEADATEAEAAEFVAAAARIEARLAEGDAAQDGAAEQAHVGDVEQRAPLRPAQPRGFEVDRARVLRLMQVRGRPPVSTAEPGASCVGEPWLGMGSSGARRPVAGWQCPQRELRPPP